MNKTDQKGAAFEAERDAWAVVNKRLPGQVGHDPEAWEKWLLAAEAANTLIDSAPTLHPRHFALSANHTAAVQEAPARSNAIFHRVVLRELLVKARDGDVSAFEAFYSATAQWLLPRMRLLVREELVELAMVDTYLRCWALVRRSDIGPDPHEWLLAAAIACASETQLEEISRAKVGNTQRSVYQTAACDSNQRITNANQQLANHIDDIRTALATAHQALDALDADKMPASGATGNALRRSLHDIARWAGHAETLVQGQPTSLERLR